MKRRIVDQPLRLSVKQVVARMGQWTDACGGRFTLEKSETLGTDYIIMEIRNIDEVRGKDIIDIVDDVAHIATCTCDFSQQAIIFRFEVNAKRSRINATSEEEVAARVERECEQLIKRLPGETSEELTVLARYIVAINSSLSILRQASIKITIQSSHGVLALTVKRLPCVDAQLLHALNAISVESTPADVVVFLSPVDHQCLRIRLKKRKRTVNI